MKRHFPIFEKHPELIYLDTAATAHKPKAVLDALLRFYSEEYATVHRAIYRTSLVATEQYNDARSAAQRFLNAASPDEIIFTKGTTDAVNLVASTYGKMILKPGDEILLSISEHHSNFVPWQRLAEETGAHLVLLPIDSRGALVPIAPYLSSKTKLVALAHVSNVTGAIHPIHEIAKAAHKVGAVLFVDGAQAAPHLPIDVQALDADFYAFSGHKCYGPTGIGILYGKKELLEAMPPYQSGGDMIQTVTLEKTHYQKPPLKFEAGTPPIASAIALKAALDFLTEHRSKAPDLLPMATQALLKIPGCRILGTTPTKAPLITFHIDGIHPLDLATLLDLKHIALRSGHLCAEPLLNHFGLSAACRLSFGLYNTSSDVDRFSDALPKIIAQLRP